MSCHGLECTLFVACQVVTERTLAEQRTAKVAAVAMLARAVNVRKRFVTVILPDFSFVIMVRYQSQLNPCPRAYAAP